MKMEELDAKTYRHRLRRYLLRFPIIIIILCCIIIYMVKFSINYRLSYDILATKALDDDVAYYMSKFNSWGDNTIGFMANLIKEIANEYNISYYDDLWEEETIFLFLQKNEKGIYSIKDSYQSTYSITYSCYKWIISPEYWASDFLYYRHILWDMSIRKQARIQALKWGPLPDSIKYWILLRFGIVFICTIAFEVFGIVTLHNDKLFNKLCWSHAKRYIWLERHKSLQTAIKIIWTIILIIWIFVIILYVVDVLF